MPTSASENKLKAKEWIDKLDISTVLDIGVGEGTYSNLLRKENQTWIGIEAYYPYVAQYNLGEKYDEVIVGDARYINYEKLGIFDIITCGDMLEHLKREEAEELIQTLVERCTNLLICFPILHLEQHDDNNPFEEHKDHWSKNDMQDLLDSQELKYKSVSGDILAYFLIKGKV